MIKTGIVMCIANNKVGVMTSSGEFVYIKTNKVLPKVGEISTGQLYKKTLFNYKYVITAASLMFLLISSVSAYAYYTPVTTIVLSINPSVSLKANIWDKIISFKALNSDGSLILSNIKLKNKSIDKGLELLVKEAKRENFINDKYIADKKIINVDIVSNGNNSIDISNFKNIVDSNNLNIKFNASSSNNKNIDITVNNKKVDVSMFNFNNKKKSQPSNETPIKNKDVLKKPSVNIDTKVIDNKSSKIKNEFKSNDKPIKSQGNKINKDGKSQDKKPSSNSSTTRNYVETNLINKEFHFQDVKTRAVKNVSDKTPSKIYEKNSSNKQSANYENLKNTDNVFHKYFKIFDN